jgi:hypothetical protein
MVVFSRNFVVRSNGKMDRETAAQLVRFITRFENEQPLYELSEKVTMMPYNYKAAISDFIDYSSVQQLIKPDCYTIIDELFLNINNVAWFQNLTESEVVNCIAVIIRQDRFTDGFINHTIEEQTMIRLLRRIKVLYNL